MQCTRTLILGAAGRDFHDFLTVFRDDPRYEIVGFTAQQIPHIADRRFPRSLAGARYPRGIPIHDEERLEALVEELGVEVCVMSYSDVSHEAVMHLASRANAAGAEFRLLSPRQTMLRSTRPVIAICASRTGAGKSPTSRAVVRMLAESGLRVVVLRHPMPYGDLARQRVQRFAEIADLDRHRVTIEEREEYEPHIAAGSVVFAGIDYAKILACAEDEADIVVWDGGNNDAAFIRPDLYITVVDPHRAGHELRWHPGETNLRLADVVLITKVDTAPPGTVDEVRRNIAMVNPRATVLEAAMPIVADDASVLRGRRVLAVEDGPTVTHGGMRYGAATLAAREAGAAEIVDPRAFAVGEIADTYERYPEVGPLLPAMGYGERQIRDLEATLERAAAGGVEAVAIGTPIDLASIVRIPVPYTRVRYELREVGSPGLRDVLAPYLGADAPVAMPVTAPASRVPIGGSRG
jgi:predicted GTPase